MTAQVAFDLAERLEAHEPPEARGLARADVRMLVARGDGALVHARARDLPDFLVPGDLVVINTSATMPSALPARRADGAALELRLSTPLPGARADRWVVELRAGNEPFSGGRAGETLGLPGGARARLDAPYLSGPRLWAARLDLPEPLMAYLARHGSPIRYRYVPDAHPLADYQNAYATEPGSAEMPSAGRPLTAEVLTALVAKGVAVAPLVLHTGVSSPEHSERPYPERYRVPASTARMVQATRRWGGRVVAVGTTVVRALEAVAGADGTVHAGEGWTALVVTPARGVRAVDGLLTGWHEPEASHLDVLHAVGGRQLVERSYAAALEAGYLWHEFGDLHLIMPA
ncbi:MAG TPA: S-adenosylmethionine:tRNA ribosyltransferase-isomerase [Solirubrobacteraceae bacterium]